MQREKKRRQERREQQEQPKRQEQVWRSWFRVEYVLFLATLAAAVLITIGYAVGLWNSGAEQRKARQETEANQQPFVKYFRHVVDEGENGENSEAESAQELSAGESSAQGEESIPVEDTRLLLDVDMDQYEDDDGLAGQVYQLKEKYPKEVETILSWYEGASLWENKEWTTVGEAYPEQAIPERLLKLVLSNEETIPVVAQYPYRPKKPQEIDLRGELGKGNVPLLLQWDPRWAFEPYGDGMLCYTGCGPTCLAMVALQLNQDSNMTPVYVANYADGEGYYTDGVGSAWTLMSDGCEHFGLVSEEISVAEDKMMDRLDQRKPLIAAVREGDFTENGHFIVITGYEDGKFTVNDPNSQVRSEQTWTFEQLAPQIRVIWAFSRKDEG